MPLGHGKSFPDPPVCCPKGGDLIAYQPVVGLGSLVGLGHFEIGIVVVENVSGQFYIDFVACNAEVFEIAKGNVVSSQALLLSANNKRPFENDTVGCEHL